MKIINKEKAGLRSSVNFENEVIIMKTVEHPHLVKLKEVFETKKVTTKQKQYKKNDTNSGLIKFLKI